MKRLTLAVSGTLLGGVLACLVSAIIVAEYANWNRYRSLAGDRASRLLERPVEIRGDLEVDVLWRPRMIARNVVLDALPDDGVAETLVIGEVIADLCVWTLLTGSLKIQRLHLRSPTVLRQAQRRDVVLKSAMNGVSPVLLVRHRPLVGGAPRHASQ